MKNFTSVEIMHLKILCNIEINRLNLLVLESRYDDSKRLLNNRYNESIKVLESTFAKLQQISPGEN